MKHDDPLCILLWSMWDLNYIVYVCVPWNSLAHCYIQIRDWVFQWFFNLRFSPFNKIICNGSFDANKWGLMTLLKEFINSNLAVFGVSLESWMEILNTQFKVRSSEQKNKTCHTKFFKLRQLMPNGC